MQKEAGAVVAEGADAAGLVGRLDLREDGGTPYQEQEVEGDQETEPHGRGPDAPVELHRATEAGERRRHPLHPYCHPQSEHCWDLLITVGGGGTLPRNSYYSWTDYRMRPKHNINNKFSADS